MPTCTISLRGPVTFFGFQTKICHKRRLHPFIAMFPVSKIVAHCLQIRFILIISSFNVCLSLGTKCNLQTNEKFSFDHKKFLPYSSRGHKLFIHSVCVCVPSDDFNPLHFWRFIPSGLFRYGEFLISKVCILNSTMVCLSQAFF